MFSSWYGLLNATSGSLPQILLSTFFGFQSAGLYAMASSLLFLPANFIGQAMGQVFLQRASIAKYSGNIAVLSYKSYVLLLKIGFFPIALISLLGPQLFSFFLGERWGGAGLYAIALVPFIAYGFAYSPLSILYTIFDKQKVSLVHEIISTLGRISGLYIGYLYKNPVISIMAYSIFCFFIQFYRMMYLLNIAGNSRLYVGYMTFKMISQDILLLFFPFLCYVFEVNKYIYIFSIIVIIIFYLHRSYGLLSEEGIL